MIRLTATGKLFLAVALLLYLASLTSQSGLLLLLIGIIAGCYVVNLIGAKRSVRAISIEAPRTIHLCEGERIPQPWHVANIGEASAGLIEVRSSGGVLFSIPHLAAKEQVRLLPNLSFERRGVYSYASMELVSIYPFGLLSARRKLPVPGEVVVYPALYKTEPPRASGYDLMVGGRYRGQRNTASGSNFAGIRPILPGDPLKQIHWKSSSKGRGLMVKTFNEELSGRISFILDCGHSGNLDQLDAAMRAAGSLMFAALDDGHHLEWFDLHQPKPYLIPPFADGTDLLERLARVPLVPGCLTSERLERAVLSASSKSAFCLVLTAVPDDVIEIITWVHQKGRVLTLCIPEGTDLPPALSGITRLSFGRNTVIHEE